MANDVSTARTAPAAGSGRRAAPSSSKGFARSSAPGGQSLPVATFLVAGLLTYGWTRRNSGNVTAETGIGYWLGIVGGLCMLLLILYPLRKRIRSLEFIGSIPGWFQIHMLLGVLGPALVVLHSNYSFGSTNSMAAMLAMLVVAGSGFIGRFLYSHVYQGFSGRKQTVRDSLVELERLRITLCHGQDSENPEKRDRSLELLTSYQTARLSESKTWLGSLACILSGPVSRSRFKGRMLDDFRNDVGAATRFDAEKKKRAFLVALKGYLRAIKRAEAFAFYERSFAAWHLLHLPLFAILVFATVAHIVAVHLY